jgi:peroxiredoxin
VKEIMRRAIGCITVYALSAAALSIGDKAPGFTLATTSGSATSFDRYHDRVCVLYFYCCECPNERTAASAVEKYLWQAFGSLGVDVLGIETAGHSGESVITSAKQWGITFPVALDGDETRLSYGCAGNSVVLIDKQGIVRAVAAVPVTMETVNAQVDSTVQCVAVKIPPLLGTALQRPQAAKHHAGTGAADYANPKRPADLKGRRLERAAVKAPQVVIDNKKRSVMPRRGTRN